MYLKKIPLFNKFPFDVTNYILNFLSITEKLGLKSSFIHQIEQNLKEPRDDCGCARCAISYYGCYRNIPKEFILSDFKLKHLIPKQTNIIPFEYTTSRLQFKIQVCEIRSFDILIGMINCSIQVDIIDRTKHSISSNIHQHIPSCAYVYNYDSYCCIHFDIYERIGYKIDDDIDFVTRTDILRSIRDIANLINFYTIEH